MSMEAISILSIKGNKQIKGNIRYPVNEETVMELKGEFRSSGKIKSRIYFGLKCFKENGDEITAYHINRVNEPLLLTSINTDGKSFTLDKKPEKWHVTNDSKLYYKKSLGLYFDGNINHLPDYIIKAPAYDNYQDNTINLNQEIPKDILDKIIPFETKVMNHYGSGVYDYSAACGDEVPEIWKEFKAEYNGYSSGYGDIKGKLRPETKSVIPFVICNYGQNEDAVLEIKNIEIVIKDKPKLT